ncbi:MAG: DNA repair protein RadA [Alphaproteobacteria bacterium]|nr:DNA repair protein RadA [Alphaproteobacteria bacterium]
MAKVTSRFVCQSCGAETNKWAGKCESCGEWNSVSEEAVTSVAGGGSGRKGRRIALTGLKGEIETPPRLETGIAELDRVTGGGLVPGSALLVGGDPGIGKSTILLQAVASLARKGARTVYISGEESVAQVRLRAERLGIADADVLLGAETNVPDILSTLSDGPAPSVVVVDSIQTLWTPAIESAPGTVSQVRATSEALIRFAKQRSTCLIFVGHVTKDGQIAGPKVIEHMVDTVLYFEGERGHQFRILRAVKNRFGATDEIGVFEMSDGGLREVENPSALFMGERDDPAPGSAVFAGMEGTRPLLVEVQALVAPSALGTPRRAVVGWDSSRLSMVLAVLEAHCGVVMAGHDVYLNVAGGMKVREPAADLAVAAALVSSLTGAALPSNSILFGEISLSGAARPVAHGQARLKEGAKLGFEHAIFAQGGSQAATVPGEMTGRPVSNLADLVAMIAVAAPSKPGTDTDVLRDLMPSSAPDVQLAL